MLLLLTEQPLLVAVNDQCTRLFSLQWQGDQQVGVKWVASVLRPLMADDLIEATLVEDGRSEGIIGQPQCLL